MRESTFGGEGPNGGKDDKIMKTYSAKKAD